MKFGTFNNPIDCIGEGHYTGKYVPKYGKPIEPKKVLKKSESEAVVTEPLHDAPFRPANPAKKGNHSTICKFP